MSRIARLTLISAAMLAGCATTTRISESSESRIVIDIGSINPAGSSLQLAETECRRYGRQARFRSRQNETRLIYDCID